jgi:hypothetical protein
VAWDGDADGSVGSARFLTVATWAVFADSRSRVVAEEQTRQLVHYNWIMALAAGAGLRATPRPAYMMMRDRGSRTRRGSCAWWSSLFLIAPGCCWSTDGLPRVLQVPPGTFDVRLLYTVDEYWQHLTLCQPSAATADPIVTSEEREHRQNERAIAPRPQRLRRRARRARSSRSMYLPPWRNQERRQNPSSNETNNPIPYF